MRTGYIADIRALIGNRPLMVPCSAGLLLTEANHILLQQRSDNHLWGLPGGALEPGENPADSARREVLEETGYKMGDIQLMQVFAGPNQYICYPNGDEVYCVTLAYICRDFKLVGEPDPEETLAVQFWPLAALPAAIHPTDWDVLVDLKQRLFKQDMEKMTDRKKHE